MSLVAWLLEQIADDERAVDSWDGACVHVEACDSGWEDISEQYPVSRLRAECDAKRKIVDLSAHHLERWYHQQDNPERVQFIDVEARGRHSRLTLQLLALAYAARSGYLEEWRPYQSDDTRVM